MDHRLRVRLAGDRPRRDHVARSEVGVEIREIRAAEVAEVKNAEARSAEARRDAEAKNAEDASYSR